MLLLEFFLIILCKYNRALIVYIYKKLSFYIKWKNGKIGKKSRSARLRTCHLKIINHRNKTFFKIRPSIKTNLEIIRKSLQIKIKN